MSEQVALGLDFGSDSVRTLAVNCRDGKEIASAVCYYRRWSKGAHRDPRDNQFRHHPLDHIEAMTTLVRDTVAALPAEQGPAICGAVVAGTCADVASAQRAMASRIEHVYQPNGEVVVQFEQLYQPYLSWAAQAEPLYNPA